MAVGAWTFYNRFKTNLGKGAVNLLAASTPKMALYTSAANVETLTVSVIGTLTNEVATGNGYAAGGQGLAATISWTAGASAKQIRFNAGAQSWKASGGTIPNIKYAVIYMSGASATAKKLICFSILSTGQFTLSQNNTLTITPSGTGIFNLTG
jgi:hypothetical protein